jgi:hypothetical protein
MRPHSILPPRKWRLVGQQWIGLILLTKQSYTLLDVKDSTGQPDHLRTQKHYYPPRKALQGGLRPKSPPPLQVSPFTCKFNN